MAPKLIVCPACSCHAKLHETHCPSCGAKLRGQDAWVAPAAAIVALGLTAVTCSDDETETSTSTSNVSQSSSSIVAGYTHSQTIVSVGEGGTGGQAQGAGGDAGGQGGAGGQ